VSLETDDTVFRAFDADGHETDRIDPVRELTVGLDGTIAVSNWGGTYKVRVPDGGSWKVTTVEEIIRAEAYSEVIDWFAHETFPYVVNKARAHFGLTKGAE